MTDLPRPPSPKDLPQPPLPPVKPAEVKPAEAKPPDAKPPDAKSPGDETTPSTLATALGYLKQMPGTVREGAVDALGTAKAAADGLANTVKSGAIDAAERVANPDRQKHEMQAAVADNLNTRGREMVEGTAARLNGVASSYADLVYYGVHNDEPGAHDKLKAVAEGLSFGAQLKNAEGIVLGAAGMTERVVKAEVDIAKNVPQLDQPEARAKVASAYTDIVLDVPQLILMADGAPSPAEGVTGALEATAEAETAGAVAEAAGEGKAVPLQPGQAALELANAKLDAAFAEADKAVADVLRDGPTVPAESLGTIGVTKSTSYFRVLVEKVIKAAGADHPLAGVLVDGKMPTSTTKGIRESNWLEDPRYLESGHGNSGFGLSKGPGGEPAGLRLQTAYTNRFQGTTLETKGAISQNNVALNIGGVPVDVMTARDLAAAGHISPDAIRNATIIRYPF